MRSDQRRRQGAVRLSRHPQHGDRSVVRLPGRCHGAGIASNRTKVGATSAGVSASDSETHAEPYFGLGINYAFSPNFDAGLAWDNTRLKYAGTSTRVNVFSAVATFKF